jgi:hypothetical protein
MFCFRYAKSTYNDALLREGTVRIGTLHDFRRTEHAAGIADQQEGQKTVLSPVSSGLATQGNPLARHLENFGIQIGPGEVHFMNCKFARSFDHSDLFLYCMSEARNESVMAEFEGADSCVEIVAPSKFFGVLTERLADRLPVDFQGCHRIQYQHRTEVWNGQDWGAHPAMIKSSNYSRQCEIRAVWSPREPEVAIEPFIITDRRLTEYVRAVRL